MTEEEKLRIRSEEIFRDEVRRDLASRQPQPHSSAIWTFLNSSFALWFLSSVVLAGLTASLTYYQGKRSEHLKKVEVERRLGTEIGNRIGLGLRVVRLEQSNISSRKQPEAGFFIGIAEAYLDNSFSDRPADFSVYPEYKARTFRSLVFELTSVVDPGERPDLQEAVVAYDKLMDLGSKADARKEDSKQEADSVVELLESLSKHRRLSPLAVESSSD